MRVCLLAWPELPGAFTDEAAFGVAWIVPSTCREDGGFASRQSGRGHKEDKLESCGCRNHSQSYEQGTMVGAMSVVYGRKGN